MAQDPAILTCALEQWALFSAVRPGSSPGSATRVSLLRRRSSALRTGHLLCAAEVPSLPGLAGQGTYSWQFIPIAGQTFTDSGSGTCHK